MCAMLSFSAPRSHGTARPPGPGREAMPTVNVDGGARATRLPELGTGGRAAVEPSPREHMLSFGFTRVPLSWGELAKRTSRSSWRTTGWAWQRSSRITSSSPCSPRSLGIALASFLPLEHFLDRVAGGAGDVIAIIQGQMRKISRSMATSNASACVSLRRRCRAVASDLTSVEHPGSDSPGHHPIYVLWAQAHRPGRTASRRHGSLRSRPLARSPRETRGRTGHTAR
jgi:hypothetical protein